MGYRTQGHKQACCGTVVLSIDTEQIWGYLDMADETAFREMFPNAGEAQARLLRLLDAARVSATWAVVGGLALARSEGAVDARFMGLPGRWIAGVPAGDERSRPLWYARSFVEALRRAATHQEIGLHGGVSHLIWRNPDINVATARRELAAGLAALRELGITPRAFVYPRDLGRYHALLPEHGFRVFRGRARTLAERLGMNLAGSAARAMEELAQFASPLVRAEQFLPGLWNLPPSLLLYSMRRGRSRLIPLRLRLARFAAGVDAAARSGGIFHMAFHPENLAESPEAFGCFEGMISCLVKRRDAGDVVVRTMSQVVAEAVVEAPQREEVGVGA